MYLFNEQLFSNRTIKRNVLMLEKYLHNNISYVAREKILKHFFFIINVIFPLRDLRIKLFYVIIKMIITPFGCQKRFMIYTGVV